MKKFYWVCACVLVIIASITVAVKINDQEKKIVELENLKKTYISINGSQLLSNSRDARNLINSIDYRDDLKQLTPLISYLNSLNNVSAAMQLSGNQSEMWEEVGFIFENASKVIAQFTYKKNLNQQEEKYILEVKDFINSFDDEIVHIKRMEGTLPLDSVNRIKEEAIEFNHN
ncbi:hypothetical protein [Paenibacillus herberti]|uniref:Uncharacterized protein n=1 Tax=Paenibacillus herberti TaxID=1619309 RepID=A0A229NWJ6_9BACL|nr:hypothetical protein [Paenibacillus herberti]OXM14316.1 hypothetical protein CGZ75_15295 [Paenibacillus herberti]